VGGKKWLPERIGILDVKEVLKKRRVLSRTGGDLREKLRKQDKRER